MSQRCTFGAATLLFIGTYAYPQDFASLPQYRADRKMSGTIRSWGHGFLKPMMKYWEEGFHKFQPDVRFEDNLLSSASAVAGLYSGVADIGILAREIRGMEVAAYEKLTKQKLTAVTVLTGSYANPDKIMALGIFVHKDNPISKLTFSQLDAIFGAERRRGEKQNIRTWGQLGSPGDWKESAIHPYSGIADEAPGFFFSQTVMKGSILWNCDLRQLEDVPVPGGKDVDGYQRVVEAVGKDRFGIGLAGAGYQHPMVKLLGLAAQDGGPYIAGTKPNIQNRSYPLARSVKFYINDGPSRPADPKVIEFLRYVLSREGQQQVTREGEFLPLTAQIVQEELSRLK